MQVILTIAAIAAFTLSAAVVSHAQSAKCYEWSDAAPIVKREGLASAKTVNEMTQAVAGGELVRITLCEEGGRYYYRLVVKEPSGRLTNQTVDALRPFGR